MNAVERLGKLVNALNEFVAEGNNDVHPEKVQKDFTAVMKAAHTLSFSAVDVATKLEAGEGMETEPKENKTAETMSRFAAVIDLHQKKKASVLYG
jgi:hypothetical protein